MNETIVILLITVGIPVFSVTMIVLKALENRKERKLRRDQENLSESELREIYYGLRDINRRIDNLETIMYNKPDSDQKGHKEV